MEETREQICKCNQHGCNEPAAYRYTWPGQDEAGICEAHSVKLRGIAAAIGCYVQLIPLNVATLVGVLLLALFVTPAHADCNAFFRKQVVYRQQYYAPAYVQPVVYAPLVFYQAGDELRIQAAVKRELEYQQQQLQAPSKGYQSPQQAPIQAPIQAPQKGSIEPLQQVAVGAFAKCSRCHTGPEPAGGLILDGKAGVTSHTYKRWGEIAILGKGVHPKMRALITAMTPEEKGAVNEALLHLVEDDLYRVDPLPQPLPPPPLPPRPVPNDGLE